MMKMKKNEKLLLWISGSVSAVMLGVMDIFLIPAIQRAAGGLRCFDLQIFGYSHETALHFLSSLSADGKALYLTCQLPVDFVFIVFYTAFFVLALRHLYISKAALVCPALLALLDAAENSQTLVMLRSATVSNTLTTIASTVTVGKSVVMDVTILLVVVGFVRWLMRRKNA